jgi:hypothetical protein
LAAALIIQHGTESMVVPCRLRQLTNAIEIITCRRCRAGAVRLLEMATAFRQTAYPIWQPKDFRLCRSPRASMQSEQSPFRKSAEGGMPMVEAACSSGGVGVASSDLPVRETHPLRPLHRSERACSLKICWCGLSHKSLYP